MSEYVTVQGLMEVVRNIDGATEDMQRALAASLYQEGLDIMAEAKNRTPVDTGRLRSTGYVAPPTGSPEDPEVEDGFGTDYGLAVHERTEVYHSVGGPKFLESVFRERSRGYARRIAERTWYNFTRGIGVDSIPASQPRRPKK